jgi:hypothetical protein
MTEETKFTVFVTASDGWTGFSSRGQTLQEVIDIAAEPAWGQTFIPLAWIAGKVADNDGNYNRLRAESIAAGRLIEHDGTHYVARGVEDKPADSERFIGLDEDHDALDRALGAPVISRQYDGPMGVFEDYDGCDSDNAAMIARDGPAKPSELTDDELEGLWDYGFEPAPKSTAKPALASLSLSADLAPSSPQVLPVFGSAKLVG